MNKVPESFDADLNSLRQTLRDVMEPQLSDERGKILNDLLENQVNGIRLFYELLLSETHGKIMIDEPDFDVITQKHRSVLRYFTKLPKAHPNSTYHLSIISDCYYLLRNHTVEWGE